jgi:hypothetical protein
MGTRLTPFASFHFPVHCEDKMHVVFTSEDFDTTAIATISSTGTESAIASSPTVSTLLQFY